MKKNVIIFFLIFLGLNFYAFSFEDIAKNKSCKYCGMDREKFSHSRMLIFYDDREEVPTCSLHCTAVELAVNLDKDIKKLEVADYYSKKLVDAEKAFWVIGGKISGVMTKNAKWAFEKKEDAEKFISENGGKLSDFDTAIKTAYNDMYEDTKMIREKRKKMKRTDTPMKGHSH
ncbi:MAG: nitrous oxide reductase accessory protein NosL [Proteobacteria bacterium]|nr:nitrous oxide reductase accessory protein NosL [Pseudomonadota bacterium]